MKTKPCHLGKERTERENKYRTRDIKDAEQLADLLLGAHVLN